MLFLWVCVTFMQLSTVSALDISYGGPFGFIAPPIADVHLAIFSILIIAALIQLVFASVSLFRRSEHRIPAVATIVALVFLIVSYILGIVSIVNDWIWPPFSEESFDAIIVAAGMFTDWAELAVFPAVALVLRNRYLTYSASQSGETSKPPILLLPLIIVFCVLGALLFIISIATNALFPRRGQFETARSLSYAFTAFYTIMTILILAFAIVVKASAKADKITVITLFLVMPALIMHTLTRIILDIVQARAFGEFLYEKVFFTSTFVLGVRNLVVVSTLVVFFLFPRLWERMERGNHQQCAHTVTVSQPPYVGGVQPPAQFPGQWGFTGQPQMAFPQAYPGHTAQSMDHHQGGQPQALPSVISEISAEGTPGPSPA